MAVLIVALVSSYNDYSKELQFLELNKKAEAENQVPTDIFILYY